jgi:hypothetical protein
MPLDEDEQLVLLARQHTGRLPCNAVATTSAMEQTGN